MENVLNPKMTAEQHIMKIKRNNACSIIEAKKLTEALHNENLLDKNLVVRFRPLYKDFDILEKRYFKTFETSIYQYVGAIDNLMNVINNLKGA